ncbi:hypothetical protein ACQUW5_05400 [Legionella sp. CNM-1927-20]|uniref:hypothetical protein n=1 Tax=Legionella sp. CNM-1927-20 TaxID=3422221 RepID=UPI00403A84D9
MKLWKKYRLHHYKLSSNKKLIKMNPKNASKTQIASIQKRLMSQRPLSQFLKWLKTQIDSGDEKFSLDAQELILSKPLHANTKFIFILPEVFECYYNYSGIPAELIQSELKKALMITFNYTIVREDKIIEVFPCHFF